VQRCTASGAFGLQRITHAALRRDARPVTP